MDGSTSVVAAPRTAIQFIVFRRLIINERIINWVYVPGRYSVHSEEIKKNSQTV